MSDVYTNLTRQEEVEDIMSEDAGPAIIDFWSTTCGPCRTMAPHFEAAAKEFVDTKLRFAKIQTDAHPHLAAPFSIRAVPTVLFVNRGEIVDAVVGFMDARTLATKAQWLLRKAENKGLLSRLFGK